MAKTRPHALLHTVPIILWSSLAMAQQGDGGASSGNVPATESSGDTAGASGNSTGTVTLSTGATIGIAIVVTIACVVAISTAVLFYMAKKRQWTVRETLRRSTRRVASGLKTAISPLTPHKATFSADEYKPTQSRRMRGPSPLRPSEKNAGIGLAVDMEPLTTNSTRKPRDLEKGEGSRVVAVGVADNSSSSSSSEKSTHHGHKPQKPSISIPRNDRKIVESPQTPMYAKMFGRG